MRRGDTLLFMDLTSATAKVSQTCRILLFSVEKLSWLLYIVVLRIQNVHIFFFFFYQEFVLFSIKPHRVGGIAR